MRKLFGALAGAFLAFTAAAHATGSDDALNKIFAECKRLYGENIQPGSAYGRCVDELMSRWAKESDAGRKQEYDRTYQNIRR